MSKVTNVNPNYKDTIDWKTLLTTIVENFILSTRHLMSFNMPQTSAIEGIVEANNEVGGGGGYLTYSSSCYSVPQTGMSFKDVRFMAPLPPNELSKGK